jgi:ubiquinone/menaquinone biosynthesis C-methylase UbiE
MTRTLQIKLCSLIFLVLLGSPALAAPPDMNDPFYSSVPSAYMDDPRRAEWQKADQVIEALFIKPGETVADIGAGTGFFTLNFARKVGKTGMVYASDIDDTMVRTIAKRAKTEKLANIRAIHGKTDDPLIPVSTADVIFICDTYLFIDSRVQYLTRLKNSLKPGGRLAIISFNSSAEIPGIPPLQRMIQKNVVIKEAVEAGYALEADYFFLPFQDFLLFRKL